MRTKYLDRNVKGKSIEYNVHFRLPSSKMNMELSTSKVFVLLLLASSSADVPACMRYTGKEIFRLKGLSIPAPRSRGLPVEVQICGCTEPATMHCMSGGPGGRLVSDSNVGGGKYASPPYNPVLPASWHVSSGSHADLPPHPSVQHWHSLFKLSPTLPKSSSLQTMDPLANLSVGHQSGSPVGPMGAPNRTQPAQLHVLSVLAELLLAQVPHWATDGPGVVVGAGVVEVVTSTMLCEHASPPSLQQ